ncbi:MAG: DNA-directed RNA polymerase subunit beta [Lentisphaerae bacterium]|jgi:DNA-directed RNA polymerase subunit beta|nr:DNA-directed RNA polymerase subunit beta [Lentisphaerota bacterium]MBT5609428.1 DNA-directed RNA polymerase subunit beta [Lentisphaerota bacterium]MBT7061251.1 DNA-directed RNA polymerase subunit beta [Lentisphaerota bacterium]MBT7848710.1 DNA-directed RNA polymerase subunit beta [Lentisphaerota bacterium]
MGQRTNFGKLRDVLEVPDLVGIQLESYTQFLQTEVVPEDRANLGFQEVFNEVFPIESFDGQCVLEFVSYEIGEPKASLVTCLKDGGIFAAPLHVTFRLKTGKEIKEERVYMGDIPIMTYRGSFVINGAERVIVSQLHRSPGICFERSRHASGRMLYSFRIIPDHGSWLEVQFDINDLIFIYLDRRRRRRKFLISTFLRAIGHDTNRELLDSLYGIEDVSVAKLAKAEDASRYFTVEDIFDSAGESEEPIAPELEPINPEMLAALRAAKIRKVSVVDTGEMGDYFVRCIQRDPTRNTEDALKEIYRRLRPGDPPNVNNAKQLFKRLFFDVRRYDLGLVGRHKINQKLGIEIDSEARTLTKEDLVGATGYLMTLRNGEGQVDDIDHLGRRRVRTVGELLQNQCRIGLMRTERLVRERMTLLDMSADEITPSKLVNPKALAGVIRDFFGRNQLSQFMDQTNCLAELTNKRRLSALGPGGLSRERAGFEVRDVHSSHYGRVCPIETPEGPNIGLISSLALYARVNAYGFIETPYRRVKSKRVTNSIDYLSADLEERYVIAQANARLDKKSHFSNPTVLSRHRGDSAEHPAQEIDYMDVSPKQLISAAAGLIPFLEHNDANRALMGSNMQRQAVPLMKAEAPYVGTGLERVVARDSRAVVTAIRDGIVAAASADCVVTSADGKRPDETSDPDSVVEYELYKFMRSNASTLISQRPTVRRGQKVKVGHVIADGSSTDGGELALGRNVMVAFMPWRGYNFEDAIVVSERLVKDDVYTSIHIAEFDITARDTKLGPEEITRDIPNVGEDALRNLDSEGVIRIGAEVCSGDILVGKITPRSETELAPEERLLRAIFGEKAADVKDSSLYVPSGTSGIVMDVRIERRFDPTKEKMSKADLKRKVKDADASYKTQLSEILDDLADKLADYLLGAKLPVDIVKGEAAGSGEIIPADRKITKVMLKRLAQNYDSFVMPAGPAKDQIDEVVKGFKLRVRDIELRRDEITERLEAGDGTDPGIIKGVKVYVASKRRISVGDKMAGRHGNKGIVARIVPIEDLPFMADGTPVDIVLNPLGVPSRMNVGQVLETHLGWAMSVLGMTAATPVFDGIPESKVHELLEEARAAKVSERSWEVAEDGRVIDEAGRDRSHEFVDVDGKTRLFDGRSGEQFAQRVMIGQIYMLKLDHLVVNKIHSRAVGPYSLVTQQPLGGKAQHGGQRFGEMEVWALEAYGAAHTLQEMLTVKSDDVNGRTKIYEAIMRGDNTLEAGIPESFNVLMKEMQSLCLDVRVRRSRSLDG